MCDSSNSSEGMGNTKPSPAPTKVKQIAPAKRWCFTVNNYTIDIVKELSSKVPEICDVYIVAKEVGSSGTPHLQGYVEFKTKCRPRNVFDHADAFHWEKAKGNRASNFLYCGKDGDLLMSAGHKVKRAVRTLAEDQLRTWQHDIIATLKQEPDDRTIWWYWSKEGNVGKTTFCKYLTLKFGAIPLAGKGADVRNGIVEYHKIHNDTPEVVLFPIPRSYNTDYVSYEGLENIKDMYFYSGKYEGGAICGNPPHLIVFANEPPKLDKMSADRWQVREIVGDVAISAGDEVEDDDEWENIQQSSEVVPRIVSSPSQCADAEPASRVLLPDTGQVSLHSHESKKIKPLPKQTPPGAAPATGCVPQTALARKARPPLSTVRFD